MSEPINSKTEMTAKEYEDKAQRIRITSDGATYNTVVTTEEGIPLGLIRSVSWECAIGPDGENEFATATVVFEQPIVEVEGEVK